MLDNIILFLFLGLILGVIWGIFYVIIAKYLKGSIVVNLPKRAYKYGELIEWKCHLHAKKDIVGEWVTAHLIGYKRVKEYSRDGKKNIRREIVARFSQNLEASCMYAAGEKKQYDISISIPSRDDVFWEKKDIELWDSTFWKLASYALNNSTRMQLTWQVQVDLEAKGFDIHGKKDIFIVD